MTAKKPPTGEGFTLIEVLIAVAVIAILAVVVVITLNPSELFRQARDASRVNDVSTLNKAISLYYQDAMNSPSTMFMGTSSVVYVSIPDPTATSTAGDQCQGLGLPALPASYTYQCAATSTYLKVNGTGWIPINFTSYAAGSVLSKLPVDPVNTTSTNLYYTYETDGIGGFKVAAFLESQKEAPLMASDGGNDAELYEKGSNLALASGRGLIGYWPLTEGGSGAIAYDDSASGYNGTWNGTTTNGTYYTNGHVGSYAGYFNGSNNYITISSSSVYQLTGPYTLAAWIDTTGNGTVIAMQKSSTNGYDLGIYSTKLSACIYQGASYECARGGVPLSGWYAIAAVFDGSTLTTYIDGSPAISVAATPSVASTGTLAIGETERGGYVDFNGSIDDVRIYNRALSASEIQEMYNAEK